jgi:ELWxxDGT repeat protein
MHPLAILLAAAPYLVRDINVKMSAVSSDPVIITTIGSTTYFAATDGVHGREMWKTDGTPAGTRMVKDIALGGADGVGDGAFAVGNRLVFVGRDDHGPQVWSTDGTDEGTRRLTDVAPPSLPYEVPPHLWLAADGIVYFTVAQQSVPFLGGRKLWRTDGTPEGTWAMFDTRPDVGSDVGVVLGVIGRSVVFFAYGQARSGIDVTDGTAEGTRFLAPTNAMVGISAGNAVYFRGQTRTAHGTSSARTARPRGRRWSKAGCGPSSSIGARSPAPATQSISSAAKGAMRVGCGAPTALRPARQRSISAARHCPTS